MQAGGSWRRAGNGLRPEREQELLTEMAAG
jgi:hypothetical protein